MTTPRTHPSRYEPRIHRAFEPTGDRYTATFADPEVARRHRQQLYAFREALRRFPDYNPILLLRADCARITLHKTHVIVTFHPPEARVSTHA